MEEKNCKVLFHCPVGASADQQMLGVLSEPSYKNRNKTKQALLWKIAKDLVADSPQNLSDPEDILYSPSGSLTSLQSYITSNYQEGLLLSPQPSLLDHYWNHPFLAKKHFHLQTSRKDYSSNCHPLCKTPIEIETAPAIYFLFLTQQCLERNYFELDILPNLQNHALFTQNMFCFLGFLVSFLLLFFAAN